MVVALPIEWWDREIDTRLFLATHLVERGFEVYIGEIHSDFFRCLKGVIFFLSHGHGSSASFLTDAIGPHNILIYQDEEGLVRKSDEHYVHKRLNGVYGLTTAHFISYEKKHSKLLEEAGVNNIYPFGGLKLMLLNEIKNRGNVSEKSTIKINTRFRHSNNNLNYDSTLMADLLINFGSLSSDDRESYLNFFLHDQHIFFEFLSLIEQMALANFQSIVVRPHPAENRDPYVKLASRFSNVMVEEVGCPLFDSLLNSIVVIHDGCTTAFEAKALGIPVIAMRPCEDATAYDHSANQVSDVMFCCAEDVVQFLSQSNDQLSESLEIDRKTDEVFDLKFENLLQLFIQLSTNTSELSGINSLSGKWSRLGDLLHGYFSYGKSQTYFFFRQVKLVLRSLIRDGRLHKVVLFNQRKYPLLFNQFKVKRRLTLLLRMLDKQESNISIEAVAFNVVKCSRSG